jgi:hypothetical protein
MYGRADGMPSSPQSVVVCDSISHNLIYIPLHKSVISIGFATPLFMLQERQATPFSDLNHAYPLTT